MPDVYQLNCDGGANVIGWERNQADAIKAARHHANRLGVVVEVVKYSSFPGKEGFIQALNGHWKDRRPIRDVEPKVKKERVLRQPGLTHDTVSDAGGEVRLW